MDIIADYFNIDDDLIEMILDVISDIFDGLIDGSNHILGGFGRFLPGGGTSIIPSGSFWLIGFFIVLASFRLVQIMHREGRLRR